jgi:hypothetical protein
MVPSYWFPTFAAVLSSAFVLSAAVFLSADPVHAAEKAGMDLQLAPTEPSHRRSSAEPPADPGALRHRLDAGDEMAALEALQVTLSEVEDGSTFVWHRRNGRVSGMFQPMRSFKGETGQVCRHFRMMLTSGRVSRRTEATACRDGMGVWTIEG